VPDTATAAAVRAVLDSFAAGDRGAIRRGLGREYFTSRPGPDSPPPSETIGPLIDDVLAAFPDMSIRIIELVDVGDGIAGGKLSITGTNTQGIWGAPATARPIALDVDIRVRAVEGGYAFTLDGIVGPTVLGLMREVEVVNPPEQMHLPPRHEGSRMPETLVRLAFNGQMADKPCGHLDQVRVTQPDRSGCDHCSPDAVYPTTRMCLVCGHLGCCDTSVEKHARAHFQETGHPLMRSLHQDERWMWCYEDGVLFGGDTLDRLASELGA